VSTEPTATVSGLANGAEYTCEVAVVRAGGAGPAAPVTATGVPFGRPPPPGKPTIVALDSGAQASVAMPAGAPVTGFAWECSTDGGSTWSVVRELIGDQPSVDIPGLRNGTDYVCRAIAINESGASDASPVSDVFRPCSGVVDCNPLVLPLFGGFVLLLVGGLVYALWRFLAGRRVYVTAQVDHFQSISLGRGSSVGMAFVRHGPYRQMAGVVPADGRNAEVRIRYAGGDTFEVHAGGEKVKTKFGRQVHIRDAQGEPHTIVVRAFDEEPR
jgi:hypothetical protein